jgi:DNA-binding transcriptional MocR family regulator
MAWKPRLGTRTADGPLYRRIDAAVREGIRDGRLRPGDRLPSVAALAKDCGVSKLTVLKGLKTLEKEGWLRSHVGRGTFVADGTAPSAVASPAAVEPPARPDAARAVRRMREGYARGIRDLMRVERPAGTIDLSGGVPSPEMVPERLLEKLARKAVRDDPRRLYEYPGDAGLAELRDVVARRLKEVGVAVSPSEVLITNGSQQAVSLVAAWARESERTVCCETPTFTGMPGAFMLFDHAVRSVPWTHGSLDLQALRATAGPRPLVYVCPDFHNPTGDTMPAEARSGLVAWARETEAVVVEDAIFRELRFEGEDVPALYPQLPAGRRFLVGSVSKSFMTGLRVGFLVADAPLIDDLLLFKRYTDLGGPAIVQAIAAEFLRDGYVQHLETVRKAYRERRDAALSALEKSMPAACSWTRPEGGFQMWVTLPPGVSSLETFVRGVQAGVAIVPGPAHDVDGRYVGALRLGYGREEPARIREGVRRLAEVVRALSSGPAADGRGPGITV